MQTIRFASNSVSESYPLPCIGAGSWETLKEGRVRLSIQLDALKSGQFLIPSLSVPCEQANYSVRLQLQDQNTAYSWHLFAPQNTEENLPASISTHIDYFQIHADIAHATLSFELHSKHSPENYLAVIATRTSITADNTEHSSRQNLELPPHSQMLAAKPIRKRICSPTCLCMMLDRYGLLKDARQLLLDCYDTATDLYGVWPVNMNAVSMRGCVGAVEVFSDLVSAIELLDQGIPLVCSIKFENRLLDNAPLKRTAGHLVVLSGINSEFVQVYDPAAEDLQSVCREYRRDAFFEAWVENQGVAYVFLPFTAT